MPPRGTIDLDQGLGTPPDGPSASGAHQRWVSIAFPWRVIADDAPEPPPAPEAIRLNEDQLPRVGDGLAMSVPGVPHLSIEGSVSPDDAIDLFRVDLPPDLRDLRVRYEAQSEAGTTPPPIRVQLLDDRGGLIDTWWLDDADGINVRLHALRPSGPRAVVIGIELTVPPEDDAGRVGYRLSIDRVIEPAFGVDSPVLEDAPKLASGDLENEPSAAVDSPADSLPMAFSMGRFAANASSGAIVDAPSVSGSPLRGTASRPLPTQGASTVGGLLPAGPSSRGVARTDAIAGGDTDESVAPTPLNVPVTPSKQTVGDVASEGDSDAIDAAIRAVWGDVSSSGAENVPDPPDRIGDGLIAVRGPGGAPLLGASIRVAGGRSSRVLGGKAARGPIEIADVAADADRRPDRGDGSEALAPTPNGIGTSPVRPSDGPTRPRVLRTALFGVVALAIGLILPDLAADRPSIRHRGRSSRRVWRFGHPRIA